MAKRKTTKKEEQLAYRPAKLEQRPLCGWIDNGTACQATGEIGPFPTFVDSRLEQTWFVMPCRAHWGEIDQKREEVFRNCGFSSATHEMVEEFRVWVHAHFKPQTFAVQHG